MSYDIAFTNDIELMSSGRRESDPEASKPRPLSQRDEEDHEALSSKRAQTSLIL